MDHARPQPKSQLMKRGALIAVVVAVLVGGGVTFASIDFSTHRVDRASLSIETVQLGTMEIKVSANGQLLPKNIEQIASRVTGRVAKTHVKPGDVVKPGQLLVELDNPQLTAAAEEAYSAWEGAVTELRAAEAELQTNLLNQEVVVTQAQFALEKAALQLEAETKLVANHSIAELGYKSRQLDVAQLKKTLALEERRLQTFRGNIEVQLAVRKSRVTQLARALDRAKNQAADLRAVAGIGGVVQTVVVDVGEQLQPGSPIGRIAERDRLYAELKVPAREAGDVQPGQAVLIDTRSGTAHGTVTRVDPAVTDGTVIVDVDPEGDLPSGARPQLPVEGVVYVSRIPDTLFVGRPAYVKTNGIMSVYKLDSSGSYATRVTIKAGKLSINHLQVLEGLQAGDRIVTSELGDWQDKDRILVD